MVELKYAFKQRAVGSSFLRSQTAKDGCNTFHTGDYSPCNYTAHNTFRVIVYVIKYGTNLSA